MPAGARRSDQAARCHAESSSIARKRQRFRAGWVQGAELVAGASVVQTRFVAAPSVVVVVLDEPVGPAVGTGLALSLDGARRPADADGRAGAAGRGRRGQPHVPRVRGGGGRTGGRGGRVRSGRPPRGRARVTADVDSAAAMVASRGLDALLAMNVPSPDGAGISWADPAPPTVAPKAGPAKKKAAKRKAVVA